MATAQYTTVFGLMKIESSFIFDIPDIEIVLKHEKINATGSKQNDVKGFDKI
jgi:hypothetical protein